MNAAIHHPVRRRIALLTAAILLTAGLALVRTAPAFANVCSPWPGCFGTGYQVTGTPDNSLVEWTNNPSGGGTEIRSVPNGTTLFVGCQANNGPQEDSKYNVYPSVPSKTWDFAWDGGINRYVWVYDWWMNTPPQQSAYNWYSWPDAAHHCNFVGGTPVAPDNVTANATGSGTIHVSWTDTNSGNADYVVSNGNTSSATLPGGTTSYNWTGLAPDSYQCFTITAKLNGLQSAWTPWICATTWALNAPVAIGAQGIGTSTMQISWVDQSGGDASFVVSNGTTSSPTLPPGTTSYLWTGLTADDGFCYTITAVQSGQQSAPSDQVCGYTRTYVNMGDSFGAGEGVLSPNYLPGTDNPGVDMCHRSNLSMAGVYASGSSRWQSVVNVACSGAVTSDVFQAPGSANSQGIPTQGEPAQYSVLDDNTGLVTVTIGGNNVTGSNNKSLYQLLQECYSAGDTAQIDACWPTVINDTLYQSISTLQGTLEALYQSIEMYAPNATVVAVTYPQIYPPTDTQSVATNCGNLVTSQNELDLIRAVIDRIDTAIKQAAIADGVDYIDEENAFAGHELCTSAPWVNPIVGNLLNPSQETLHPNALGYAQEAAIAKSTLDAFS